MSKVHIGASTVLLWVGAVLAAVGAAQQQLQDHAPWLAVVSAALLAVNNGLRAWQAARGEEPAETTVTGFTAADEA